VIADASVDHGRLRLRERASTLADDVRDFLRHSR
jgi:hypothetical protein